MEYKHVQARISSEELKSIKKIGFETEMTISKLLRIGLQMVVEEYKQFGAITIKKGKVDE